MDRRCMGNRLIRAMLMALASFVTSQCQPGYDLIVQVRDNKNIYFYVQEEDRDNYCVNSVEITRYPDRSGSHDGHVVWYLQNNNEVNAPCNIPIVFPNVPPGYDVIVPASELIPGYYIIEVYPGVGIATGTFEIGAKIDPKR